jgi:hypothetical protein
MQVTDEEDNSQITATGLNVGGYAGEGAADHRLRRAALGDMMCCSYTPASQNSTKSTFSVPIIPSSVPTKADKIKTLNIRIINTTGGTVTDSQGNVSPVTTPTASPSDIATLKSEISARFAVASIQINCLSSDTITVPGNITLYKIPVGSGGTLYQMGQIASTVKSQYPDDTAGTVYLIIIGSFDDTAASGRGYTEASVDSADIGDKYCSFMARITPAGGNSLAQPNLALGAHEIAHQLLDQTSADLPNYNCYTGLNAESEDARMVTAGPFPQPP